MTLRNTVKATKMKNTPRHATSIGDVVDGDGSKWWTGYQIKRRKPLPPPTTCRWRRSYSRRGERRRASAALRLRHFSPKDQSCAIAGFA
ncbi:hypothetical protein GW17_00053210 [Ensete ventricosum]|nr:hypothetical protein GW17_00053210 [Ensete ventricosum]